MNWKINHIILGLSYVLLLSIILILPACRQQKVEEPKTLESSPSSTITVEQVQKWMNANEPLVFLDSRSAHSWDLATTKIVGALRVPPNDVEPYLPKIPRGRKIIVYCT
jgi:hypothetical protein